MEHVTRNKRNRDEVVGARFGDTSAGFTLVEMLVAVTVLIMAVVAPLTIASQGLRASRIARDQMVATYLAQEVVEYARMERDSYVLDGEYWLGAFGACMDGARCTLDITSSSGKVEQCPDNGQGPCDPLRFNEVTGFYVMTEGEGETKFTRSFTVYNIGESPFTEARVSVRVTWLDGIQEREMVLEEYILNWQ